MFSWRTYTGITQTTSGAATIENLWVLTSLPAVVSSRRYLPSGQPFGRTAQLECYLVLLRAERHVGGLLDDGLWGRGFAHILGDPGAADGLAGAIAIGRVLEAQRLGVCRDPVGQLRISLALDLEAERLEARRAR